MVLLASRYSCRPLDTRLSTTVTPRRVTPDIIMVDPLTDCNPTVTHSLSTAAGVVDTKVKSIGGCTGSRTATNYGVCSAYKLIGYAGKVNGCAATAVDPGILRTHNRHVGIGNGGRGVPGQDTIGDIAIHPHVIGLAWTHCETLCAVACRHCPEAFKPCDCIYRCVIGIVYSKCIARQGQVTGVVKYRRI